tara:strand:- start:4374 stop:5144 length:771 start_codon:yes stop_codon:yes gene_type:complete
LFELGVVFLLGLLWGSFANVVIYRWPRQESFVFGRSHCPHCKALVSWWQNIPVLSFLILGGKCRSCGQKISRRYPLVELLTGMIFLAIYWKYGMSWSTLEYFIFGFGLVTVSFIDLDHMLLPDIFTLPGIGIGLIGAYLNPERSFQNAWLGVLVGGGILWSVAVIYYALRKREGMGGGDIKLLAWIGAILGLSSIPVVLLFASLWGSFFGILMSLRSKDGAQTAIPFGPYLALGALFYLFFGEEVITWYFSHLLPP